MLKPSDIAVIVLAAGKGVRMQSDLPKVFHNLGSKPLLQHVLECVKGLSPQKILVVVGHKKELIENYFSSWQVNFVHQKEQLGTGHAVMQAEPYLKDFSGQVLVLAGDVPFIKLSTLKKMLELQKKEKAAAVDLTCDLDDPASFGRVVRNAAGDFLRIVEKKDATPDELKIKEINTGTFSFNSQDLFLSLKKITNQNVQKEYYLTDAIEILQKQGKKVKAFKTNDPLEAVGINTKDELAQAEKMLIRRG